MVNELRFLPPNQGSVNEKLYDLKALPLDCILALNFCPSPDGNGSQVDRLVIFFIEKLLKETPNVPVRPIPPPKPADSSNWSPDFSSTPQFISTVPFSALGVICGFIFSGSINPSWPNSLCVRIIFLAAEFFARYGS